MKITEEKVWLKYYSDEALNAELPKCTAYEYMCRLNQHRLDKPALHYFGRDITHRELQSRIEACANAFAALGVKAGDVVSFLSVSIPETISAVYALNKLGAAANAIDPRMDVGTIEKMVSGAKSRILVVIDVAFPKAEKILDATKPDLVVVQSPAASLPPMKKLLKNLITRHKIPYSDQIIKWEDFIKKGAGTTAEVAPYVGDAIAGITYTGGTTSTPKGTMLTNDSMNAVALSFIHCDVVHEDCDRFLGIIPVFTAYGMVCGMHMPLCMDMTLVPVPSFVPTNIGKLIKTYRPNHLISTPVFIELLMESKELQNMDLSFLRTLACGGDTMNEGLEQRLNQFRKEHKMKYPLAQGYGMSELSAAASFCVNRVYKSGSVGIPSLNLTVGIFDQDGNELGYREIGEVCVTGPTMMKGYFNNPKMTAETMRQHEDGLTWIHSGDLGYMDEDGFLYIQGRIKRMITRFDGHKIFPVNIEGIIAQREDVINCAVIGVNDREHAQGQYPLVVIMMHKEVTEERKQQVCGEIFRFCDENLEERGKPVAVLCLDEVPLTPLGKNDFKALEKEYQDFDYLSWSPAG